MINAHEGCIIAANHTSFLDPPLVGSSIPFPVYFLARDTLFHGKIFSYIFHSLNAIPVTKQIDHRAFKSAGRGYTVVIFPEGSRSVTGELENFNLGVALLAKTLKKPVIPAYIEGAYEIWPRTNKFPKLTGKTSIAFGPPCYLENFAGGSKKEQYRSFTQALEKSIKELKNRDVAD